MDDSRWTVRVAVGGGRCSCPENIRRGDRRRTARGVGAGCHDDRAVHCRCGGDDCDGFGRDGCTGEAQGYWRLSSPITVSVCLYVAGCQLGLVVLVQKCFA